MPPKKMTPPPIDRPLSKAYLREFAGWSTAYPPGLSEPNSLRIMENVTIDRDGAAAVRPGLRYLSYAASPDLDPGTALAHIPIGSLETFYTRNGSRAALFAVREDDGTVGFRALLFTDGRQVVHALTDPEIGFSVPQGAALNFGPDTTHVEYLQINNRILAMSDAPDSGRLFYVGDQLLAKKLKAVSVPEWEDTQKLSVIHPDAAWIDAQAGTTRTNVLLNPSFELGIRHWTASKYCGATTTPSITESGPHAGQHLLELRSLPQRTNLMTHPLLEVPDDGAIDFTGWNPDPLRGAPTLNNGLESFMYVTNHAEGLFLVDGPKLVDGISENQALLVAAGLFNDADLAIKMKMYFYSASGAEIGTGVLMEFEPQARIVSPTITTPPGTVAVRLSVGGEGPPGMVGFRDIMVCAADEPTDPFPWGAGYFWTGAPNASVSVYHPPQDITLTSRKRPIKVGSYLYGSMRFLKNNAERVYDFGIRMYDKEEATSDGQVVRTGTTDDVLGSMPVFTEVLEVPEGMVSADVHLMLYDVARGDVIRADAMMLEPDHVAGIDGYFDGSVQDFLAANATVSRWENPELPHESNSIQTVLTTVPPALSAEIPTDETLIATGDAEANPYKMAFFYTFENEVGESAPSKITEIRMHRAWSNWEWKKPSATGEPTGADTEVDTLCADQLVVSVPQAVYEQAVAEGAVRWNLYGFAWSDQDAVSPTATLIGRRELYPDPFTADPSGLPYDRGGRYVVTPSRSVSIDEVQLPTVDNRVNYSIPPRHTNGLVAGDRMVLVGSPDEPANIRWSSNRPGEYTNFTDIKGGGVKTLSSGNLNLPVAAVLWQNPQSVGTITLLCTGDDRAAVSYYMAPAKTESSSAGTTAIMGFEETTNTPGTTSPYGCEVLNNALYRPLDMSLLKSTASNYNISHKPMTDLVANVWAELTSKHWIMSAQLDNRLYYLVHNPRGEVLADDCKGNEIWVYDVAPEKGSWSRFLIQGSAIRTLKVGSSTYVAITRPDGIYYLDPLARLDDYVSQASSLVQQRPIPWRMETNTQGANRAHDAWAHLQQVGVLFGSFRGSVRFGVRGHTINGTMVDTSKIFQDQSWDTIDALMWDTEDALLVRRDMKEWTFYAESIPEQSGWGRIGYVQYRYTPVTVNVGYEYGSVETFEYGRDALGLGGAHTVNGIPVPMVDWSRP